MAPSERPVALITGGSRGIGRALVERFLADGWAVVSCARTERGAAAAAPTLALACDVADPAQVRATVARVVEGLGRIDVLVNNAGLAGENSMDPEASDELWHRILDVNLNGTYYMCKHAAPHLPDRAGRIVNVASVLALRGVPDQPAYVAAKHGVLGLTRALAHRLGPRGITVNAICPGWTRTEMALDRWRELGITEAQAAAESPLGRVTEPEEVAALAAFLASEGAGAITGQALTVDGGALA